MCVFWGVHASEGRKHNFLRPKKHSSKKKIDICKTILKKHWGSDSKMGTRPRMQSTTCPSRVVEGWSHPPSRSLFRASLKFVPLGLRLVETAGRQHTFSLSESQKEPLPNHIHAYSSSWSDCATKVNYDKTVLSSKDLHPPNSIPRKF